MRMQPDTGLLIAAILNAGWMVRNYALKRTRRGRLQRAQAIQRMGLTVRDAFERSDDYEALLGAVVDGLRPKDNQPF